MGTVIMGVEVPAEGSNTSTEELCEGFVHSW